MKEFLYGWIRDIAFYAILMTVILHLLPEEGQKKYVRFFMGVVLMLVVLSPLLSVAGLSGTLDSIYWHLALYRRLLWHRLYFVRSILEQMQ